MSLFDKLFGKKKVAPAPAPAPEDDEDDGDFVDIDLPIVSMETFAGGAIRVVARGTIEDCDVGLAVELGADWDAQPLEDVDAAFYWGHCTYRRTGPESDRFVALLARRYGLMDSAPTLAMLPQVAAKLVGLNSDPAQVATSPLRGKAFFHIDKDTEETPEAELRYAEVFTNIDTQSGIFGFHEKDSSYRLSLLRALTQA